MEIHVETFADIYKKKTEISIERLFKYVQNSNCNNNATDEGGKNKVGVILYSPQNSKALIDNFMKGSEQLPMLFVGVEASIEDYTEIGLLNHFLKGGYIKIPFDIKKFIKSVENLNNCQNNSTGSFIKFLSDAASITAKSYEEINELLFKKDRGKEQHRISGLASEKERILALENINKKHDDAEFVYAMATPIFKRELKVLIIDNEPDTLKDKIQFISKYFKNISFHIHEFIKEDKEIYLSGNIENITYNEIKREEEIVYVKSYNNNVEKGIKLNNFDFILLDLHLANDGSIRGEDILNNLYSFYPEIPVFILSSIEETMTMRKTLLLGADDYIPKSRLRSFPYRTNKFYEEIGKIVWLMKDKKDNACQKEEDENYTARDLRRNLIGNIRKWRFNKELLWFGDKCYHMINHSYEHSLNEWKLLNKLLYPIIKKEGMIKKHFSCNENLYCLCMAVWLHDIGHSGNERYGAPYEIRDNHGIVSGEFILKYPDLLRIHIDEKGKKEIENQYKGIVFPFGPQRKPVTQIIMENVEKREELSMVEKIALLSIYHKSNSPISKDEYKDLINKDKTIPIDFFRNCDRKNDVITLDDILDNLNEKVKKDEKENFKKIVSIFRFVDALDIRQNRVGSEVEKEIKKCIIQQDKIYLFEKLKREIESIIQSNSGEKKIDSLTKMALMKIFYQDVKEKIKSGESVSHLELQELAKYVSNDLDNYFMLANYASFISVQDGHFDFHSSIEDIEIKPINDSSTEIIFKSSKELKDLAGKKIVRDPGEKEKQSVVERLIGTEDKDGYVIKEYKSGGNILNNFVKLTKITLLCKGKEAYKPDTITIQYKDGKCIMDDDTKNKLRQYSG